MRYVPFRYAPALKIQFPPKVGEHKISESKFGLAENQRLEKRDKNIVVIRDGIPSPILGPLK